MILETSIRTLEELYDDFIKNYEMGNFVEGVCSCNDVSILRKVFRMAEIQNGS